MTEGIPSDERRTKRWTMGPRRCGADRRGRRLPVGDAIAALLVRHGSLHLRLSADHDGPDQRCRNGCRLREKSPPPSTSSPS